MITPIEKLSPKFRHISVDPDTRIKTREERTVAGLDAVYEKWAWEGVVGQSYIFANGDVEHLSDAELLKKLGLSEEEATRSSVGSGILSSILVLEIRISRFKEVNMYTYCWMK